MENLFQSNFNQLFDSAEIKELEASVPSVPCALTELQKQALVKAVLYVISADGVITEEEKTYFVKLCAELNVDDDYVKKSVALSDSDMFAALKTVSEEQEVYIMSCLNEAAFADNELAEEESMLLQLFSDQSVTEKPKDFYQVILTF